MKIVSTRYQRKRIHIGTTTSPDGNTVNQIDHVMVDAKRKGVIEDVRTMRGPNCYSDHFLVKAKTKQKLIRIPITENRQIKWNQNNLTNDTKLNQYRTCLGNKLDEGERQRDIAEEWVHIKQTIIEAAEESIETQTVSTRNGWWDEECKQIMTQKNEARKKYFQSKTRACREAYETRRTETNRVCRRKKQEWLNNKIKYIEELNDKKNTRKFFKEAQLYNKQQPILPNCCKDKKGNILSEQQDILQIWKQYFSDLQNLKDPQPETDSENITYNNIEEVPPPTYHEVTHVIDKLKIHKASGSDNISAELIKVGGTVLKQRIHKLIERMWEEKPHQVNGLKE